MKYSISILKKDAKRIKNDISFAKRIIRKNKTHYLKGWHDRIRLKEKYLSELEQAIQILQLNLS